MADDQLVARSGGGDLCSTEPKADRHQDHQDQRNHQQQPSCIFELSGESAAPRDREDEGQAEARVFKVDEPVLSNPWPFYLEDREEPASKWRVEGEDPGPGRAAEENGPRGTEAKMDAERKGQLMQANPWAYFGPLSRHDEGGDEDEEQHKAEGGSLRGTVFAAREDAGDVFSTMSGLEVALPLDLRGKGLGEEAGRRERGYSQGWRARGGRDQEGEEVQAQPPQSPCYSERGQRRQSQQGSAACYTPYSPPPGRRESGDRRRSSAARISYRPYRSPSPETALPSEPGGGFDEVLSESSGAGSASALASASRRRVSGTPRSPPSPLTAVSSPRTGAEAVLHHGPARLAALPGGEAACDPTYPPIPLPLSTDDHPEAQSLPRPQQQQQQQAFHAETPSPTPFQTPASDQAHAVTMTPLSSVQGMPSPASYYAPTPPAQLYGTPHTQPMPMPMPMPTPSPQPQPQPQPQPLVQAHPQQHLMQYQPVPIPGQSPPPPYIYYNGMGPGAQPLAPAAPPAQQCYYPASHPPQPGWPPQPYPHPAQPAFAAARDDFVPALPPRPPAATVFAGQPAASWTGGHGTPGGMYGAPPPPPPAVPMPVAYTPQPPSKKLFSTATARRWLDKTSALLENKLDSVLQGSTGQWQPPRPVYQYQYVPPAQAPPGPQGYPGPQPYPYYPPPGQGGAPYQRYA